MSTRDCRAPGREPRRSLRRHSRSIGLRDLVDAFGIRLAGMVADAESDVAQLAATGNDVHLEHHPEATGRRWQVDLEAMR